MHPKSTLKLTNKSQYDNLNKIALSFSKIKKSTNKFRLKTEVENEDSKSGKIKNNQPFSTKHKNNLDEFFFRKNSKSSDKSDLDQQHIKFQQLKFKHFSHKPSKKSSFNMNLSNINCSGNLKNYAQRNNSIDRIYNNRHFQSVKQSNSKSFKSKRNDSSVMRKSYQKKYQAHGRQLIKKQKSVLKDSNQFEDNRPKQKIYNQEKQYSKFKNKNAHKNKYEKKFQNQFLKNQQFNVLKQPISPNEVNKNYSFLLKKNELSEIQNYEKIYYLSKIVLQSKNGQNNNGFDDKNGYYIIQMHQHIAYRFEIIQVLGKGSFGQVFKSYDHKNKQYVALKIIKNKKISNNQAKIQLQILNYLKQADQENFVNIVHIKQYLAFRNHHIMIFQLLSMNLYELIKFNKFSPLSSQLVRRISIQILSSLLFLFKHNIIHCDIKPENILLKSSEKSGIKLIDFGSSCFTNQKLYSYIQSRYYRAPQIILGYDYSTQIDMWSFGCVAAQLKLSYPIFYGQNQEEQVALITEVIGKPQQSFYSKTERGQFYFNSQHILKTSEQQQIIPQSRTLDKLFGDPDFVDFLKKIFVWDPKERLTPLQALKHKWILKGLPNEIKQQHLQFLQQQKLLLENIKTRKLTKMKTNESIEVNKNTFSQNLLVKAIKQFQ